MIKITTPITFLHLKLTQVDFILFVILIFLISTIFASVRQIKTFHSLIYFMHFYDLLCKLFAGIIVDNKAA